MKQSMRYLFVLGVFIASLSGCGEATLDSATAEKLYYADAAEQQRAKVALQNAGIPFEVHAGVGDREEIWYESRFAEQVGRIGSDLFGVPPPMGRNISLGVEGTATFIEELKERNASFWRARYHDQEYIAWPPESDEAADAALQAVSVNPDGLAEMKKMRAAADAEQQDRTNRSSRSREERAPAER